VAPSPVDLWATEPTIEMTRGEKKPALMVLNRANQRARLTAEIAEALKELGTTAAETMIGNRIIFASCMGDGRSVMESQRSGPAAREILELTHEIVMSLKQQDQSQH
jgi:chromosome partitioning protein